MFGFSFTVVDILQLGFSGFAFLLAYLAFLLLRNEQKRDIPVEGFLHRIELFMGLSITLAVLTIISPIIKKQLEEKPNPLMEAAIESAKNRKPLPLEFVESQIAELTQGHNKRLESLYSHRTSVEKSIDATTDENKIRELEKSLRRIDQHIRDENGEYNSKISKLTYSL